MQARPNPLKTKSVQFALDIIEFNQTLIATHQYVISKQLVKSGTSMGANIYEAQSPESKYDFIHKLKIAAKEASETDYWLELRKSSPYLPDPTPLQKNLVEIQKMLSASISTSRAK